MKLGEAADACMRDIWQGSKAETTAQINADAAVNFFGANCQLSKIRPTTIESWKGWLASQGNGPATINRKLAALSRILRYAVEMEQLDRMPLIRKLREPEGRKRFLTDDELANVIAYFTSAFVCLWDHANAVEVLVDTGLRPSELWKITAKDIAGNIVIVRDSKNGKTRGVPLTQRAAFIMQRRSVRFEGRLFPYNNAWMERGWSKVKLALDLAHDKEFLVYSLRHTYASRLVQRNIPLQIVQQLLGHSQITTTERYAHLAQANFHEAIKVLEPGTN